MTNKELTRLLDLLEKFGNENHSDEEDLALVDKVIELVQLETI